MEVAADQMSPCCDLSLQRRTHHDLIWGDVTARHHDWQINLSWDWAERDLDAILETRCPFSHTVNYSWTEVSFSVLLPRHFVLHDCWGSLMDARTLYWWESWAAMTMNPYRNSLKKEEKWILLISFIVHIINSVFQSETFRLQDSLLEDSVSAPWTEETPAAFKDSSEAQTSQHQCSCVSKNLVRT